MTLTPAERQLIVRWIHAYVDDRAIPEDEGNGDALRYNLTHLALDGPGYQRYNYGPDHTAEILSYPPVIW